MARKKLTQKLTGFPMFQTQTNGFTFPLTHSFTKDLTGLDGLSLDLQFATDKSLTARKGPTPVFTRASTATFVGSNGLIQSAAINQARFDHDPSTLVSKGLLIEESRTNNVTRSQEMNLWTGAGGSTRSVSTENSPDGITKATLASGGASAFGDIVARSLSTLTSAIGTSYTVSCFVKKINYRYVSVDYAPIRVAGLTLPFFDLDTLVFSANGSSVTGSITAYPNGWYRLSVSGAALSASSSTMDVILCSSTGTAGSSRSGQQIYLWGAQLEAGAFPTSYIPTTTASLARSADVCSITGSAFTGMYNQSEGTINMSASTMLAGNAYILFAFSDGTTNNFMQSLPGTSSFIVNTLGVIQANLNTGSFTSNVVSRVASAFKLNDFASSRNGGTVSTDNAGTLPTVNQLGIGSRISAVQLNGHIEYIRHYKKRLANAKLVTLTT